MNKLLVVDCGNGSIKAVINNVPVIIPSLFSERPGEYIRGGFKLNDADFVVGWDNINQPDATSIIDLDNGKIEHLDLLICGAISALKSEVEPDDTIEIHLLTLNPQLRDLIEAKIKGINKLYIDGSRLKSNLKLKDLYPEGYGSAIYAQNLFQAPRVVVLDLGNGTLNLSQYDCSTGFPRRERFDFVGRGFSSIIDKIVTLYGKKTSNGFVDATLIRDALEDKSYLYRSDYKGKPIWDISLKAVGLWLEDKAVKSLMVTIQKLINQGIPVVCCGGGFEVEAVRETIKNLLNLNEVKHFHFPENPTTLGVLGLYDHLAKEAEGEATNIN